MNQETGISHVHELEPILYNSDSH